MYFFRLPFLTSCNFTEKPFKIEAYENYHHSNRCWQSKLFISQLVTWQNCFSIRSKRQSKDWIVFSVHYSDKSFKFMDCFNPTIFTEKNVRHLADKLYFDL